MQTGRTFLDFIKIGGPMVRSNLVVLSKSVILIMLFLILSSCNKSPDKTQLNSFLFSAVSQGDDITVRGLLQKGADANARDFNGCTPVVNAASGGYLSTIRLLVDNGADVNTPCSHGANALSIATSRGYEAIVRFLLEKGADVNRTYPQGGYALSYAIEAGHPGVARALIEHGAEINVRYSYHTPLIHAAQRGRAEIVRILLGKGADVRATDHNRMSAMMQAIDNGYPEIAKELIEGGSDVNLRAGNGYTPLSLARQRQQESVIQALLAAGASGPNGPFVDVDATE
jgi:ankyrin repeat protein